jgi:AmmeMemoRadiSam system protein B
MIRKPAVAGQFYPGNPGTLKKIVDKYMDDAKDFDLPNLKALICPHAGYPYSGPVAGYSYRQLENLKKKPSVYFLIGPSHFAYISSAVGNFDKFETPLGQVRVNKKICEELEKNGIPFIEEAHIPEHSLEAQLPFLQTVDSKAEIVPILCGSINPDDLAEKLEPYFKMPDTFFLISSDLSHYLPYEEAVLRDQNSIKKIEFMDIEHEDEIDACGNIGIRTLMRLSKNNGYQIKLLDYRNSGDTAGDRERVVGYGAVAIYKPM